MGARFAIFMMCAAFISITAFANDSPPEPESYRMENYRSPTPATLKGARVLSTEEAHDIWRQGAAAFIDVLPQAPRPSELGPDVVWRDKPRASQIKIPGPAFSPIKEKVNP